MNPFTKPNLIRAAPILVGLITSGIVVCGFILGRWFALIVLQVILSVISGLSLALLTRIAIVEFRLGK
jgi:hypothetical protein